MKNCHMLKLYYWYRQQHLKTIAYIIDKFILECIIWHDKNQI